MWDKFKYYWKKWCGWEICPVCNQQTLHWTADNPIHPDGPSLFCWWECINEKCLVRTDIEGTSLMNEAARKYGYKSFIDFLDSKI